MHQVSIQEQNLLYPQYQSFHGLQQPMGVSYRPQNSIPTVGISQPMTARRVHKIRAPMWHSYPSVSANGPRYLPFPNTIASMKQTHQIQGPVNIHSAHQLRIQNSRVYLKQRNQTLNQREPVADQTLYSRIHRFQTIGANASALVVNNIQAFNSATPLTSNINQPPEYTWIGEGSVPMVNDGRRY